MSTGTTEPSVEPTSHRLKLKTRPTASAVLWGHLLSSKDASQTASSTRYSDVSSCSPLSGITPVDKTGSSLRILLHDTQANLEKFSDRVTKLTGDINESKREIGVVKELLQTDHEKVIEQMVELEIQRAIGVPAQAAKIHDVRADLTRADTRLTALESKMYMLQVINQTQLQALQTVQDQQGKIIAAISPVLPLLQAIPLHIDNSRRELLDGFRDLRSMYATANAQSVILNPPPASAVPQYPRGPLFAGSSPANQSDSGRHKKRKLADERTPDGPALRIDAINRLPDPSCTTATAEYPPQDPRPTANGQTPRRLVSGQPPASPDVPLRLDHLKRNPFRTPHRPPPVNLLPPNAVPRTSDSALSSAARRDVSSHTILNGAVLGSAANNARSPVDMLQFGVGASRNASKPPPPVQGTPKNANSLASTTSTLSQTSVAQPDRAGTPSIRGGVANSTDVRGSRMQTSPATLRTGVQGSSSTIKLPDARLATYPDAVPVTPARSGLQPRLDVSILRTSANSLGTNVGKPMSIKDVRALNATPAFRNEEKRFIPLDDDDDDDLLE
ncbi:uncharacterized protein B0H18DRAFT_1116172 [Fomitopsis serialis]|uniref:uncharacterized protein n=1 Tax=Fomitopsis serialis TaxID=139415 RepID=UPI002007F902|nr:uncharacterized protein B0H18DRAFT_1116172 [Neoantrodia serialis]KAH9931939.1 hypothetical protein B0H18DRAFT_1116172 [Neoantrodia serialis]